MDEKNQKAFAKWFADEGVLMARAGCTANVLCEAAWFVAAELNNNKSSFSDSLKLQMAKTLDISRRLKKWKGGAW